MSLDTSTTSSPAYVAIPRENWRAFFDVFTNVVKGRRVEIEVAGLAFGDQIEVEWLTLNGLTYDSKEDAFYVYVEDLDHAIPHPREILVRTGPHGIEDVVAIDHDQNEHLVRLREPLLLPPPNVWAHV